MQSRNTEGEMERKYTTLQFIIPLKPEIYLNNE
jgi:hypothetical protein